MTRRLCLKTMLQRGCLLALMLPFQLLAATPAPAPAAQARIRLFGQNGVGLVLYTNARCTGRFDQKIRASGSIGNAFGSLLGRVKNESIGIPATETTRNLATRKMIGSKPYFKEYTLSPGQPVIVEGGLQTPTGWHCDHLISAAFTPVPGADYEVGLDVDWHGGICTLPVSQVAVDGQLTRVPVHAVGGDCDVAPEPAATPLLVFLFEPGTVQYRATGSDASVQASADDAAGAAAFEQAIRRLADQPGAKVCAVVPSYDYKSPLHDKLYALLSERGDALPGIWEETDGMRRVLGRADDHDVDLAAAETYCSRAATMAFGRH